MMNDFWIIDDCILSGGVYIGSYAIKIYSEKPNTDLPFRLLSIKGKSYYQVRYDFKDHLTIKDFFKDTLGTKKTFERQLLFIDDFFDENVLTKPLNNSEIFKVYEDLIRVRISTYNQELTFLENVPYELKTAHPSGLIFEHQTYLFLECELLSSPEKIPTEYDYLYIPDEEKAVVAIHGKDLAEAVERCHSLKMTLFRKRIKIFSPATADSNRKLFKELIPGAAR